MTVGEMIAKLQEYDQGLPVALADWNEGDMPPSLDEAAVWNVIEDCPVMNTRPPTRQKWVLVLGAYSCRVKRRSKSCLSQ